VSAISCRACRHFIAAPAAIENSLPGMGSLSSGHGATRAGDGLCGLHDRFVAATARCAAFASSAQALALRPVQAGASPA
jgi:hypothetical protein